MERLQKYLAKCGVASRRQAEKLIAAGRIRVNGAIVREMGLQIDPARDEVILDDRKVEPAQQKVYLMLNKPRRVITTLSDPQRRAKVSDLLRDIKERVYPVGRLDYHTEGLLLLTNDGEMAYRLTHPRFEVEKEYIAEVKGSVGEEALEKLRRGVLLEDGLTSPAQVRRIAVGRNRTMLDLVIHEGRNRVVRRMCEAVGHPVLALKRVRFGPLKLEDLPSGAYRHLTPREVEALKKTCRL